jgi:hypothetical protein
VKRTAISCVSGGTCTVEVFAMKVTEEAAWWPEADFRTREWMPPEEAASRVDEAELKRILETFPDRV